MPTRKSLHEVIEEARWYHETSWYLIRAADGTVRAGEISHGSTYEYDLWDDTPYDTEQAATAAARDKLATAIATVRDLTRFRL